MDKETNKKRHGDKKKKDRKTKEQNGKKEKLEARSNRKKHPFASNRSTRFKISIAQLVINPEKQ